MKLAVFATHSVQYQVPWFRALAAEPDLDIKVYYAMVADPTQQGIGFGVQFEWDVPLLDGYPWQLLENRAPSPSLGSFWGCRVRNLHGVLRSDPPDAALITGWHSSYLLQALWSCRRLGIPTLVRGDSNVLAPRGMLKTWLQRRLIHRFSAFLAVGELNRRLYEQAGIRPERIFFCPHFIDNERFSAQAEKCRPRRAVLRERWGIPEDATCFLFSGKLTPKKRVMDFVAAVAGAATQNPAIHGLIVGSGEMIVQAQTRITNLEAPITLTGFLNQGEIAAAYEVADCLVLPSDYGETWGLVVNEAMACGRPAVVSDRVGCGPDLVEPGVTGEVFPFGDAAALAEALRSLAADPQRLESMGRSARVRVMEEYSVEKAVEGTVAAVDYLLGCSR